MNALLKLSKMSAVRDTNERERFEDGRLLPHERLMQAILIRAIRDLDGSDSILVYCQMTHRRELRRWFYSVDDSYLFSFVNVCSTLHLNPKRILRELEDRHLLVDSEDKDWFVGSLAA